MIELRNITKSYVTKHGRIFVFKDLSMTFPENKSVGIMGPNGAGKSTLLRLVGKIDFPDKGEVITDKRISWPVALSGGSQGSMTGSDNVRFVCRIYGIRGKDVDSYLSFIKAFADIGRHFDLPVKTYSSGMRARLNFGISMAFDFDYYLVDEVTAVGDEVFKKKSAEIFSEKKKKANLIMVSHNMRTLRENCEAGVYINRGHVEYFDDINDAIKLYSKS